MQIITRKEAIAQGLKRYFTGKPCKHGHIAERQLSDGNCLTCHAALGKVYRAANKEKRAARGKVYRAANRDKILARMKACYTANREEVLARQKVYIEANKEKVAAQKKDYYEANKKKESARVMAYRANNPQAKTATILRIRIGQAIRAAKAIKSAQLTELLGASVEEVRAHLEAQFKLGMTWDNWSLHGWHVDHIKPCASFDLTDPEQQKACFHYSNLQPLWAKDNQSKSDRLDWVPAEA